MPEFAGTLTPITCIQKSLFCLLEIAVVVQICVDGIRLINLVCFKNCGGGKDVETVGDMVIRSRYALSFYRDVADTLHNLP